MSIDKSLKMSNRLQRSRNVLSRAERIAELRDREVWEEGQSIYGLPKVRVFRAKRRGKPAEKKEEAATVAEAETAEGAKAPEGKAT